MVNYRTTIPGNEALLERLLTALETGQGYTVSSDYPFPLVLDTGERFLLDTTVRYFLTTRPLDLEGHTAFFERLRLAPGPETGFRRYRDPLDHWVEAQITERYADFTQTRSGTYWKVREPVAPLGPEDEEFLRFVCYLAPSHQKYGPSYASVQVKRLFDLVTALGSDLVKQLKKHGSGALDPALANYADEYVRLRANDAFASIAVTLLQDVPQAYQTAYTLICQLLDLPEFPHSFSLKCSTKEKQTLPVKGLKKVGAHYLAAGAVRFPELHPLLERYADLAMVEDHWLLDLDEEEPALPGTFAVFALALASPDYFLLLDRYLEIVDDEHQYVKSRFAVAFVERYGITEQSLPHYLNLVSCAQEDLPPHRVIRKAFTDPAALRLLLAVKPSCQPYDWQEILLATFGDAKQRQGLMTKSRGEVGELYGVLFEG